MSARPGVLVTVRVPASMRAHPGPQAGEIVAEVRCHWPDGTAPWDVGLAIQRAAIHAISDARAEIARQDARGGARDARNGHGGAERPGQAASEAREAL